MHIQIFLFVAISVVEVASKSGLLPVKRHPLLTKLHSLSSSPSAEYFHNSDNSRISETPPSQDPFYNIPADISRYPQGAIIRSRKVPDVTAIFGPDAGDTYQLFYRTNGVGMIPDASVTTVIAPKQPRNGSVEVVAIAAHENSPAADCAISWAVYPNSKSKEKLGGLTSYTMTAKSALFQGYYVTLPDPNGSKSGWLAYSEGQIVLDSILAIVNHKETIPDSRGYRAAIVGYSGGGHGAAWAGQLASTYARETPIVAVAAGGVPIDLAASLTHLDGTDAAALSFLGICGLSNAYPKLNEYMLSILKPNGTKAFGRMRDGSYCLEQALLHLSHKSLRGSVDDANLMTSPIMIATTDENHLGMHQAPITKFPLYLVHSQADDFVVYEPSIRYYQTQCARGAKIIFSTPTSGSHRVVGQTSLPASFHFIKEAFEGRLKVTQCRQSNDLLIPYNGPEAMAIVSEPVVDELISIVRKLKIMKAVKGASGFLKDAVTKGVVPEIISGFS